MPSLKKSEMRNLVPATLEQQGFKDVRKRSGQGLLPGSRLQAMKDGAEVDIAVKTSATRTLNFTKQSNDTWRTASAVDWIIAVVPPASGSGVEIIAFEAAKLVGAFNKAWAMLEKDGRSLSFAMPVFVPLDKDSPKNLGHDVVDLKRLAHWSVTLDAAESTHRNSISRDEFYARIKREIAEFNKVDVSQVEISIQLRV